MTAATELSRMLRDCSKNESLTHLGSLDPAADLIPVPRYLVDSSAELLQLLEQQTLTLKKLADELAGVVDDMTRLIPTPNSAEVHRRLQKVRDMKVQT